MCSEVCAIPLYALGFSKNITTIHSRSIILMTHKILTAHHKVTITIHNTLFFRLGIMDNSVFVGEFHIEPFIKFSYKIPT